MSAYQEASQFKAQLTRLLNEAIENHPIIKSAIKAKKATVANIKNPVNTTAKTVVVRLPFDTSLITLPYNPQMESYLTSGTVQGKPVSVWYNQSINNGIVMQNGDWSI